MHAMPYPDKSFDLVIHSDTLEHVTNPIHALQECRRILKPGGAVCFTVPVIVDRMSRNRTGLEKSYHGSAATGRDDYIVQTEFGADVWTYVMQAGFQTISIHAIQYPAALAIRALTWNYRDKLIHGKHRYLINQATNAPSNNKLSAPKNNGKPV